jgi:recyclin-1
MNRKNVKASILSDSRKTQEHKRIVMETMKAIMFAPIALTSLVIGGITKKKRLMDDIEPINSTEEIGEKESATYNLDESSMNSFISLEFALHLMHKNKESLGRALVITSSTDITKV